MRGLMGSDKNLPMAASAKLNPVFRPAVTARRAALGAAHLVERAVLGPLTPQVRSFSRTIFMWENATLLRFHATTERIYKTPVLIIPPLMVNPDIFDLRPGHSLVHFLLDAGFDVFLVDFGSPTDADSTIRVDDYVTDFIPKAIGKILEHTGESAVSTIGWSMGGIMSMLYASVYQKDAHVRNAVVLGSPFDFSKMFPANVLMKVFGSGLPAVMEKMGNLPPILPRVGFEMLAPFGLATRYLNLLVNYWDREYVAGFETIRDWGRGFIAYPQEAFVQFVTEFIRDDKVRRGQLVMKGRKVDLAKVEANLLLFVGTTDKVASPESVEALVELVGSRDKKCVKVPVGHIGLITGSRAKKHVWTPMALWLAERS